MNVWILFKFIYWTDIKRCVTIFHTSSTSLGVERKSWHYVLSYLVLLLTTEEMRRILFNLNMSPDTVHIVISTSSETSLCLLALWRGRPWPISMLKFLEILTNLLTYCPSCDYVWNCSSNISVTSFHQLPNPSASAVSTLNHSERNLSLQQYPDKPECGMHAAFLCFHPEGESQYGRFSLSVFMLCFIGGGA